MSGTRSPFCTIFFKQNVEALKEKTQRMERDIVVSIDLAMENVKNDVTKRTEEIEISLLDRITPGNEFQDVVKAVENLRQTVKRITPMSERNSSQVSITPRNATILYVGMFLDWICRCTN